jgi:hypothetical protein
MDNEIEEHTNKVPQLTSEARVWFWQIRGYLAAAKGSGTLTANWHDMHDYFERMLIACEWIETDDPI